MNYVEAIIHVDISMPIRSVGDFTSADKSTTYESANPCLYYAHRFSNYTTTSIISWSEQWIQVLELFVCLLRRTSIVLQDDNSQKLCVICESDDPRIQRAIDETLPQKFEESRKAIG